MRPKIGVVLKPGVPQAVATLRQVLQAHPEVRWVGERDGHHALDPSVVGIERVGTPGFLRELSMVLVLGGDGTLIHAASLLPEEPTPILGVNMGHIGFLTEVTRDELPHVLPMALAGKLPQADRMRLTVTLWRHDTQLMQRHVLNDVTIAMRSLARIATFRVTRDDSLVTTIRGDGLMVSTPTGSTAYALAAGGPIIMPEVNAILLTPICPHQLTQRPLVLPPHGCLKITLDSDSTVFASLDGHHGQDMRPGDVVTISVAPVPTRLLGVPWRDYYQTLRTKLRWGEG